jgi:hypothetical protein
MGVEGYLRVEDKKSSGLIGVVIVSDGGAPRVYAGRFDLADLTSSLEDKGKVRFSSQKYAVIPISKITAESLKEYLDNRIRMVSEGFHHGTRHKSRPNPGSMGLDFAGGIST